MNGKVRFHHIAPGFRVLEMRSCAKQWVVFHDTYSLALVGSSRAVAQHGSVEWRYRHGRHVVGPHHLVMAMQPGELHATLAVTPEWDAIVVQVSDLLMKSAAAELGWSSPA